MEPIVSQVFRKFVSELISVEMTLYLIFLILVLGKQSEDVSDDLRGLYGLSSNSGIDLGPRPLSVL